MKLCAHARFCPPGTLHSPHSLEVKIHTDPVLDAPAAQILPQPAIICHMGAGMAKKQWPVSHWAALYKMATAAGLQLAFTPGHNPREQLLASELKTLVPEAPVLPIAGFVHVSGAVETLAGLDYRRHRPLHFAAGLDGADSSHCSVLRRSNVGRRSATPADPHGDSSCHCDPALHVCQSANPCLAAISPEQIFDCLQTVLAESKRL